MGSLILSPLRQDRNPTCSFFRSGGKVKIKDFATGFSGDCFDLVSEIYGVPFKDSLSIINRDFNLGLGTGKKINLRIKQKKSLGLANEKKEKANIQIEIKDYSDFELSYYNEFGISYPTLKRFNVYSTSRVFYNKQLMLTSSQKYPIFTYYFPDTENLKIYRPLRKSTDNFKWIGNTNINDIYGLHLVDYSRNYIIVTSSGKDAMTLFEMGFNVIATQGEGYAFSERVIKCINKFPRRFMLFDNDEAGQIGARKKCSLYSMENIVLPQGPKDPSDFYKKYGEEKLKTFMKKWI